MIRKLTLLLLVCSMHISFSYAQVCDNVTSGGEIGYDQTLCSPGEDPAILTSISLPMGGSGNLQYLWISTTNDPSTITTVWDIIVGADGESYDPGPLFETTYFRRCARRSGCTQYIGETNILKICVDMEAPHFTSDLVDGEIDCNDAPAFDTPTYADDCGSLVGYSFEDETIQNGCTTDYIRTFTIVDDCGKSSTTTQTFTTTDNEAPVISLNAPNDAIMDGDELTVECDNLTLFSSSDATATNNCDDNPTLLFSDTVENGDCLADGYLQRWTCSWTAKDACGNTSTFTVYVNVVDTTAPIFTDIPADETVNCGDTPTFGTPTYEDNCDDDLSVTSSDESEVDGCTTVYTKTWTITDDCGNTATASQSITTTDDEAPVITLNAPNDGIMDGDTLIAECDNLLLFYSSDASATDNCDADPGLTFSDNVENGNCLVDGYLQFWACSWTATDDCGNTSTFTVYVRVIDITAPVFTYIPASETIECLDAPDFGVPTYEDNCDDDLQLDMTTDTIVNGCTITYVITWKISDDCGNSAVATQSITAVDNTAPTISLDGDYSDVVNGDTLVAECGDVPAFFSSSAIISDNCDDDLTVTFSDEITNGNCIDDGFIRFFECTWTAIDACGNSTTFVVHVKVVDTTAPIFINVPDDETIQCDETPVFGIPTFSDNCDSDLTESVTQDTFYSACSTEFLRTWTITDDCGNSATATQFIWAIDNVAPTVSLIAPYENLVSGDTLVAECTDIPMLDPSSIHFSDNCDANPVVTFSLNVEFGDCPVDGHIYIANLAWTVSDACGNATTFELSIRVVDTTAPTFVSVPDITVASCDSPLEIDGLAVATDHCTAMVGVTYTVDTIVTFENIKYQINWTAKDDCQNSADTLQVITVPCDEAFLFTNISGELMGNTVLINWTGLNEYPSGVYVLERSKDGVDFNFLNNPIPAEGIIRDFVDYAGWDASPYEGHNYYRVQYIDERARLVYSDVVRVDLPTTTHVNIFPNPAFNYVMVELNEFSEEAVIVELYTRDGVLLETHNLLDGNSSLRLETKDLQAGMYFITVKGNNTRQHAMRFVKSD